MASWGQRATSISTILAVFVEFMVGEKYAFALPCTDGTPSQKRNPNKKKKKMHYGI